MTENNEIVSCSIRKTAKKIRIVVGDKVKIMENEYDVGKYIIYDVFPRLNSIPRPPLANIDKLIIVIAIKPEPDLLLVDKLIIYCMINKIEPIIVINKSDIATSDFITNIQMQYYFLKTIVISSKNKTNISELSNYIKGKICAVCGQSAVGKSSLLNALIPNIQLDTQELSEKINRGKHTTRVNELYLYNDLIVADTPGFSNLELNIDYKELQYYYPEFEPFLGKCRYIDCSHIKEGKDCLLVEKVENGEINKERYSRYIDLYNKLKEVWDKKYD